MKVTEGEDNQMIQVKNENNQRTKAILMILLAGVLWSTAGVLIKWISWNPVAIAGMRSGIAALIILAYMKKPKIRWSKAAIAGALAYATTVITFISANKFTTSANAILLQYTSPIYVLILGAWFLGERATRIDLVSVIFTIFGMILFFFDDLSGGNLWGNLLAILSGLSFAAMVMFLRKQKDSHPLESVLLGNIITAIIGLPFMFISIPTDAKSWSGLLLMGIFQLGLSYILYAGAIKHVTALEASLIPIIEPILNPLWTFVLMGEVPGLWAFVGGMVVLGSVVGKYLYVLIQSKKNNVTVHR